MMAVRTFMLAGALFLVQSVVLAQDATTFDIFQQAAESKKNILLIFSGSDWCAPCMRIERDVLSKREFLDYASKNLLVYKADFPQRKKLTSDVRERNAKLADRYNQKGSFPSLLLLNADGSIISHIEYSARTPMEFIEDIRKKTGND